MIGTPPTADRPPADDAPARLRSAAPLRAGRLRTTDTAWHWAFTVIASGVVTVVVALLGLSPVLAVALGLAWAVAGISDLVATLVVKRFGEAGAGVATHRLQIEQMLADQFVDKPTHGWLAAAHEALVAAESRFASLPSATADDRRSIAGAVADIRAIEVDLARSRDKRRAWRDRVPASASGSFAKSAVAEDPDVLIRLYGDPANLPDRLGPRSRDVLARVGAVLDDVRILNTPQTEWAVLLFTLWARVLLVAGAPLLASASLGYVPLQDGWSLRDLPWALASAWSTATALCAPWIATTVMRRDARGAQVRRRLLLVEIPLSLGAIVLTPCWAVATFAAGWTNWWQRPEFVWLRLWTWMAVVCGLLAAGMAIRGTTATDVAMEFVVAMTVVAIIGASYGAMLPLSTSLLLRTLIGGLLAPRRARDRADARIAESIRHLLDAAHAIELRSPDDPQAARDVGVLRESARMLGVRTGDGERWAHRTPLGLAKLVERALQDAGVMSGEPRATLLLEEAERSGDPEPVTLEDPTYHQRRLKPARFRRRREANALRLLITEVVREARRHGTGPLTTVCRLDGDRVIVRFANRVRPGPARPGRGNGAANLRGLAQSLPGGRIDTRGMVSGSFIELPGQTERFGVEASFSTAALEAIEDHPT